MRSNSYIPRAVRFALGGFCLLGLVGLMGGCSAQTGILRAQILLRGDSQTEPSGGVPLSAPITIHAGSAKGPLVKALVASESGDIKVSLAAGVYVIVPAPANPVVMCTPNIIINAGKTTNTRIHCLDAA